MTHFLRSALIVGSALLLAAPGGALAAFVQTNLVSSATDSDLINPWGISSSPASPFWVSDNGTGRATLYNSLGVKQGLIVSMPNSSPITGQVFNGTSSFNGDLFLFASEDGTINGWRGALGTNAQTLFTVTDAVYKGIGISSDHSTLYAANFHSGDIDVFDSAHSFPILSVTDPNLPAGYAPFNIQNVGGTFYVTFAMQDAARHDDVGGVGSGIVDTFNPATNTFTRLITGSNAGGTVDALNSPWGLAIAPSDFGEFANDLLVGNFGDGAINAFNTTTGALLGTLSDLANDPIINPGLWGLRVGNGGNGGSIHSVYLTAGGANEDTGLFARLDPVAAAPEPATLALLGLGLVGVAASRGRKLQ